MGGSWIEIERARLLANVQRFRERVSSETRLMAVVKANAYGHDARLVAPLLRDVVDWYGVDALDEARELADLDLDAPILILGHTEPEAVEDVVRLGLRQALFRRDVAEALAGASEKLGSPARVHLKIETGLNRLGVPWKDTADWGEWLYRLAGVELEGVYTHFADVEDVESSFFRTQLERLAEAVTAVRGEGHPALVVHASPSAGALLHPGEAGVGLVRVGIGLFGLWPSSGVHGALPGETLSPVLSWKSRLAQVKTVPAGSTVGYDLTYRAATDRRVGVVPVGYYDGFDRGLSNRGQVLVRGRRVAVVGRVAMNMFMVDVTETGASEGDEVVLLGEQEDERIGAEEMASWIDTIAYEVVARLSPRIPRHIV